MTRSEIMSRIRSKNTKPEVALARALRRAGLRPKRHDRLRPGTPDFVRARAPERPQDQHRVLGREVRAQQAER